VFDFAVIGLGPAGATAARLLGSRYSVLAIDKKPQQTGSGEGEASPGFRKPCGGLLAPDAQRAIAALGLTLPKELLVDPQIFCVHTSDLQSNLVRWYQRLYLNLDRDKFDHWLISLIGNGKTSSVELIRDAVFLGAEANKERGFTLRYSSGGTEKTAQARHLIGADGAASALRREFFPRFKIRSYTAIQEWFDAETSLPLYSCFFDNSITDSYCWGIFKDGLFVLGGAFPHKHALKAFETLKEKIPAVLPPGPGLYRESCQVLRPLPFQFCTGRDFPGGSVFFIGEAAGFISPSSLEGISYALDSASVLADMFLKSPKEKSRPASAYAGAALSIKLKIFLKNCKSPFMYNRLLRGLVMKSGITSIKIRL
jgi:flavin-dependent dehydrogenase